ncbi:hypothetical protein SUNDANCE_89 [Brevibacillus phage Sundance]|uniref:hypothetical protein n=1 Tax=Brevibacillus phage Sundance TaxID=1691958 RepID=UPI0006BCDDF5|nr:hypothetical protein AVT09_gp089 [Brevibacillus phage Sundance]ALA47905.1 hypothetical protein SUNDANCE_89 [Brevibacillus phage Sundance]
MEKEQGLLSTFEMIEKIAIGQSAITEESLRKTIVTKKRNGSIVVRRDSLSGKYIGKPLPLTKEIIEAKWTLKELEIDFPTALRLIGEGKTVRCYYGGSFADYSTLIDSILFDEIVRGKWATF